MKQRCVLLYRFLRLQFNASSFCLYTLFYTLRITNETRKNSNKLNKLQSQKRGKNVHNSVYLLFYRKIQAILESF